MNRNFPRSNVSTQLGGGILANSINEIVFTRRYFIFRTAIFNWKKNVGHLSFYKRLIYETWPSEKLTTNSSVSVSTTDAAPRSVEFLVLLKG